MINIKEVYYRNPSEFLILSFSLTVLTLFSLINDGFNAHPDSKDYANTLELIAEGKDISSLGFESTLFRPLMYYLAIPLYYIFGDALMKSLKFPAFPHAMVY